jgi:hypothetical protein
MMKTEAGTPEAEVMLAAPEIEESSPVPPPLPGEGELGEVTELDEPVDTTPHEAIDREQETSSRLGLIWRVAEIVLGAALISLLVAVFWQRRRG